MFACTCCGGSPPRTFYQLNHSFEVRCRTSLKMRSQFPGYVPIIFEPEEQCRALPSIPAHCVTAESSKTLLPAVVCSVSSRGALTQKQQAQRTLPGSAPLSSEHKDTHTTCNNVVHASKDESVRDRQECASEESEGKAYCDAYEHPTGNNDYSDTTYHTNRLYDSEVDKYEHPLRYPGTDNYTDCSVNDPVVKSAGYATVDDEVSTRRSFDEDAAAVNGAGAMCDARDSSTFLDEDTAASQMPHRPVLESLSDNTVDLRDKDDNKGDPQDGTQRSMYRLVATASSTFARRAQDMSVRNLWSLTRRTREGADGDTGMHRGSSGAMGCYCSRHNIFCNCANKDNDSNTFFTSRGRRAQHGQYRGHVCHRAAAIVDSGSIRPQKQNTLKFIMPGRKTLSEVILTLRERLTLAPHQAIFLTVGEGNVLAPGNSQLNDLYDRYRNADGFLYIAFALENTFG